MKVYPITHWACVLLLATAHAQAIEFNDRFLSLSPNTEADLSAFSQGNSVQPGKYLVDLYVNQDFTDQFDITFVNSPNNHKVIACLPAELLPRLGLKPEVMKSLPTAPCVDISTIHSASIHYNQANARLVVSLPQAVLQFNDSGYIPPDAWHDGVPALLLDYQLAYRNQHPLAGNSQNALTSYGVAGANAGPWRVRSYFQYYPGQAYGPGKSALSWYNTHAWRDIRPWHARLALGELSQNSQIFDSFSLTGVSLNSDERMIPPSLRGYAPRIEGIARTNAVVTVSRQGRTLYSTTVPPGPFSLQNLGTSLQGQLDVTIAEADGTRQTFTVYSGSIPYLTRKGGLQYKTAFGQATSNQTTLPGWISSMEASWGASDSYSLYGGSLLHQHYQAYALGVAKDLGIAGAISSDLTVARAQLTAHERTDTGRSMRFNYAKHFTALGTDLRLFGYRFSDKKFWSLNDFITQSDSNIRRREKQRIGAALFKQFGKVSAGLTLDRTHYWHSSQVEQRVSLNLNRTVSVGAVRNVSVNLSLTRTESANTKSQQVYLGVNVPLTQRRTLSYNATLDSTGKLGHSANFSGSNDSGHSYSVGASLASSAIRPTVYGHYSYDGARSTSQVSLTQELGGYRSMNASVNSSLLLHAGGLTASKGSHGQTRVLVNTDKAADIGFVNKRNLTDQYGHTVLDNVSPYARHTVSVDMSKLPDNVEVKNPIQNTVLTDGAVGYTRFKVRTGRRILASLRLPNGKPLPLGAHVRDESSQQEAGLVGEDGLAYLTGVNASSQLVARWGKQACQVALPSEDEERAAGGQALPLTCAPTS